MKNNTLTCCFTGHRRISSAETARVYSLLLSTVDALIRRGVTRFACGGAIGFDMLAGEAVLSLRMNYPHISLNLILPCHDQDALWQPRDKTRYSYLLSRADDITYVSDRYNPFCMMERNRRLVESADICVCYLKQNSGGTFYTVGQAGKAGLEIINLAQNAVLAG